MDLEDPINTVPFVGPKYAKKLKRLGIDNVEKLLLHIPSRYLDYRKTIPIINIKPGDVVTISGKIDWIKNQYTKTRKFIQLAQISDSTGSISAIWFNQTYLIRNLKNINKIRLSGKVDFFGHKLTLISPDWETADKYALHTGRLVPIYPETYGLSSKWIRSRISYILSLPDLVISDHLPDNVLKKQSLIGFKSSIHSIHFPENLDEALLASNRLAFDELLFLHLNSIDKKLDWQKRKSTYKLKIDKKEVNKFIKTFPFSLTNSQKNSIFEILNDLQKETPMNRLLEGDVGSGKTVVSAIGCFISFLNGYQSMIMAPTQILAQQHYETIRKLFKNYKVRVSLITSSRTLKDPGKNDIFIGTHSLLHKNVDISDISFVVIDEQHRFGVEQRAHLTNKFNNKILSPHVLTMTATPIPRTIVLTIYGDLSLSTLDELPKGRRPIKTYIVPPTKRNDAYNWVRKKIIKENTQCFVVCPLIEESESSVLSEVKAVTTEYEKLKSIFPKFKLGLLHGRLKIKEKDMVLDKFGKNIINILVTTPVIEVGIDFPNATIIIIEGSERFGLAQLHQLRGRVGRSDKESFCLLFTNSKSESVKERLTALQKGYSGFKLAELDLKLRGPGEIFGTLQHGYQELKIASWQDTKLIKATQKVAQEAEQNPKKYENLFKKLFKRNIVFN